MEDKIEIKIQKTVEEAIDEIKSKLYLGEPLTTDTMLIALGALIAYKEDNT